MFLQLSLQKRGGGAEDAWHFSEALVKNGFAHHVMVAEGNEHEKDFTVNDVRTVDSVKTYPSKMYALVWYTLTLFRPCRWLWRIKNLRPTTVYATHFHPWLAFIPLLKKIVPCTFIYTVHENPYGTKEASNPLMRLLERFVFNKADVVIAHSQYIARVIEPQVKGRPIYVLLLGAYTLTCPLFKPVSSRAGDPLRALFFGRLEEYKGLDVLLRAFELVKKKQINVHLALVGRGELSADFLQKARLLGVEIDRGWVPPTEVCAVLSRADVLVLPYRAASQSGVVSLGLGVGLPLIVTRVGGLPEYVEHEKNGLVVDCSAEAIASALETYALHPELVAQHGEESKRRGQGMLSWEMGVRGFLEFFKQLKHAKK